MKISNTLYNKVSGRSAFLEFPLTFNFEAYPGFGTICLLNAFKCYFTCRLHLSLQGKIFERILKDYKKYYIITATPEEIYIALTNPVTLELWTGEKAEMSTIPGTEFSLWEGSIVGKNIDFTEGKKIVQQWYFGDQQEDSIVTILLHPHKQGTSVELRHTNIPDEDFEEITEGWDETYFGALAGFYE